MPQPTDNTADGVRAELNAVEAQVASLANAVETAQAQVEVLYHPDPAPAAAIVITGTQSDPTYVGPTDTWESVAARLGVTVEALFAANAGLGGCTTMQTVPVGNFVTRP